MTANSQIQVLDPVRPNEGLQAEYRRQLMKLIDEMHKSIEYWLKAAYKRETPEMAQDASPAVELQMMMRRLARRWNKRFAEAAKELAAYFAQAAADRSDVQLKAILRKAGISVSFRMTKTMNDVMQATIGEQVGLIRSIASQHLSAIEGMVMRSVAEGRDLFTLSKNLREAYGVTKRRAALIARDQNNKASAVLTRVRQTDLGITEAIWQHSHAGKEPRRTHVAAGSKKVRYKIAEGWYDSEAKRVKGGGFEGAFVWPGTLINCRCTSRPIIPGLGLPK